MLRTPIFIISFNRLAVLQRSIASFQQIPATSIVIHDAGSTYQPLLQYLDRLERDEGVAVYRHRKNIDMRGDLNLVAETVKDWLGRHSVKHYVVTDPDIELGSDVSDIVEFYAEMLVRFPDAEVVGPMLRIDDIPDHYPLKARAIQRHTEQFWHKKPLETEWRGRIVQYQFARIDTTFGMYRSDLPFSRLRKGIRTYAPYWARHLDWYIDPENMTPDQVHYLRVASPVSHWGGALLRQEIDAPENIR